MTLFLEDGDQRKLSNVAYVLKGESRLGQFSGVLISNDLILTVAHSINYLEDGASFYSVNNDIYKGQAVYLDEYEDVAIFQLNKKSEIKPATLELLTEENFNKYISLIGYHKDFVGKQSIVTATDSNNVSFTEEDNALYYDLDALQGSSGGALINNNGNLIGINTSQYSNTNAGTSLSQELLMTIHELDVLENYKPIINDGDDVDIHRFLNVKEGSHFYTRDAEVINDLYNNSNFKFENIINNDDTTGQKVVYELYNKENNSYLYTSNLYEIEVVEATLDEFDLTGVQFSMSTDLTIYRLFNPETGNHFYTDNFNEARAADLNGFNLETNL